MWSSANEFKDVDFCSKLRGSLTNPHISSISSEARDDTKARWWLSLRRKSNFRTRASAAGRCPTTCCVAHSIYPTFVRRFGHFGK